MGRALLVFIGAAFAAVGVPAASSGAPETERVYEDAIGENAAGPDVTTVSASSDGATLTLRVAIPTNPVVTPDMRIRVWLDADDSPDTGLNVEGVPELTGFDTFVLVDPTRFRPDEAVLYGCGGDTCAPVGVAPGFTYASGATFTIAAWTRGLRRFDRVRFSVVAQTGIGYTPGDGYDFANAHVDVAPDEGVWMYDSRPLRMTEFGSMPSSPRAGARFTVTMRAMDTATGATVASGRVACRLRVAGIPVPARVHRIVRGIATCAYDVPRGSRGQRFTTTIRVTSAGATLTRSLAGTVR